MRPIPEPVPKPAPHPASHSTPGNAAEGPSRPSESVQPVKTVMDKPETPKPPQNGSKAPSEGFLNQWMAQKSATKPQPAPVATVASPEPEPEPEEVIFKVR